MDLSALSSKVRASRLLTESEREYWLSNMPRMTMEQLQKLTSILAEAEALPWNQTMQTYMSIAGSAVAALAA